MRATTLGVSANAVSEEVVRRIAVSLWFVVDDDDDEACVVCGEKEEEKDELGEYGIAGGGGFARGLQLPLESATNCS